MTNFYVYEDNKNKKVRVHVGHCNYCRDGKGLLTWTQEPAKKWYGPYDSLEEAQTLAKTLPEKDIRTCRHCLEGKRF
jgi:hypothetical protein